MPYSGAPGCTSGVNSRVSIWNWTAVSAFFTAMSTATSSAPSMRTNATRSAPPSTTAMHIGWPISSAVRLQTPMMRSAASRVTCLAIAASWARNADETSAGYPGPVLARSACWVNSTVTWWALARGPRSGGTSAGSRLATISASATKSR
jgi:hypothetical protein